MCCPPFFSVTRQTGRQLPLSSSRYRYKRPATMDHEYADITPTPFRLVITQLIYFPPFQLKRFIHLNRSRITASRFRINLDFGCKTTGFTFRHHQTGLIVKPDSFIRKHKTPATHPSFTLLSCLIIHSFQIKTYRNLPIPLWLFDSSD